MAKTWEQMIEKGRKSFETKLPGMKARYDAAKPSMKAAYGALPFGSITKGAYNRGVDRAEYRIPDIDKWARKWREGAGR